MLDADESFAASARAAIAGQTAIEALGRPIERPRTLSPDGPPPPDLSLFGYFFRAATDDYASFTGRARRKAFWGFLLFYAVGWAVCAGICAIGVGNSNFAGGSDANLSPLFFIGDGLVVLYGLGMILPGLAIATRRLHDTGRNGWWQLLHVVPIAGTLVLVVLALLKSQPGPNRYGPSPLPTRVRTQ